jgi:hypothetical protein
MKRTRGRKPFDASRSRWPSRAARILAAALFSMSLGADCEGNILSDPTFRDWCGDGLCKWRTDSGAIQRVSTWNANDLGVSLLDGAQISQPTEESEATCILFTTVANIDPKADVTLSVDFDDDGTVERSLPLGASQWHQVRLEITAPPAYAGIRFAIRKKGTGTAILAEMRVQSVTGCTGPAPVLRDLVSGQRCASDNECDSGVCSDGSSLPGADGGRCF